MSNNLTWLPSLITLEEHMGSWEKYLNALYDVFTQDFIMSNTLFRGQKVGLKKHPMEQGKEATFWHLISDGKTEADRLPDLRRCERIRWPKPVIQNNKHSDIRAWENTRKGERRVLLWLESENYLVVLADRKGYLILWTAYLTTHEHTKRKLRAEHDAYEKANAAP